MAEVNVEQDDDGVARAAHGSEAISQDVNTDERFSVGGADARELAWLNGKRTYDLHQTLDTDAILAARKLAMAEDGMRLRHAEELHKQALRHAETEHVIKVQTLSVASVGNSKIIENIAAEAANRIVDHVKARLP